MEENDLLPWTHQLGCAEKAPCWQELLDTSVFLVLSFFSKEIKKDEWEEKAEEQSFCLCWKRIRTLGKDLH